MQQQVFKKALSNKAFFDYFNEAAQNVVDMAQLLFEAVDSDGDIEQKTQFAQIGRLRTRSGEIRHSVFTNSGKTLISPFERSDMTELVNAIDTVAGYINISSRRINLYLPVNITPEIKLLSGIVLELSHEIVNGVKALANIRNVDLITEICNKIKSLEHYADKVYNKAVAALLVNESNPIELIKHNEILHALETTTDKGEKVASVIEAIVVKNS